MWLWSPPNRPSVGKSYIASYINNTYRAVNWDPSAVYFERPVEDGTVIIIDPLTRDDLKWQDIERVTDGTKRVRLFMGGNVTISKRSILMICSNYTPY